MLGNVLVSLQGGTARYGYRSGGGNSWDGAAPEAGAQGAITIPARKLLDICRALPEGAAVSLVADTEHRIRIQSGRSRFTLSTLPAEEFPRSSPKSGNSAFYQPRIAQARAGSNQLCHGAAGRTLLPERHAVEITSGRLRVVATDGHRLALANATVEVEPEKRIQAILPRKGISELNRLLGQEGEIKVTMGTNHLSIECPDYRFTTKLVDGAYPDYERVVPIGGTKVLEGERDTFRQAFSRTAILSNEKYRGVRLEMESGKLVVVANNPDQEFAEEEVPVVYSGERLEVGFNVGYLLDVFNALSGGRVRLVLSDANSSVLLTDPDAEQALYVIMPMRL